MMALKILTLLTLPLILFLPSSLYAATYKGIGEFEVTAIDTDLVAGGVIIGEFTFTIDVPDPSAVVNMNLLSLDSLTLSPNTVGSTSFDLTNTGYFFLADPDQAGGLVSIALGGMGGAFSLPSTINGIPAAVDDWRINFAVANLPLSSIGAGPPGDIPVQGAFTVVVDEAFPFANFSSSTGSITLSTVPIPAAAWLFGSAILGLVGVARRKKA